MNDDSLSEADALRAALVDQLCDWGVIRTAPVEDAMRAVPRHLFVPQASAERAYANEAVITHRDADGVAVSSASAPGIVAAMLEQLEVEPGNKILEIGAGTGYNAALLAQLTGPTGQVTTIDIDEDVVAGARRGLAAAGCDGVEVICGDGDAGYPATAPYDRIIVTAGAWEVSPSWWEQLGPAGRLVLPLRMRGLTRSIAFEREGRHLVSRSIEMCGFVPMRGIGGVAERNIRLGENGDVILRIDDGQHADAEALASSVDGPASRSWSGVRVAGEDLDQLDFWLVSMDGFCRLIVMPQAVERGLAEPVFPWGSMGVFDEDTVAYLTRRPNSNDAERRSFELGVWAYGPRGENVAHRFADRIRTWDSERRSMNQLSIEVHPLDTDPDRSAFLSIDKRRTRIYVRTS